MKTVIDWTPEEAKRHIMDVVAKAAPKAMGVVPVRCTYRQRGGYDLALGSALPTTYVRQETQEDMDLMAKKAAFDEWLTAAEIGSTLHTAVMRLSSNDPQLPGQFWQEWVDIYVAWVHACPATGIPANPPQ